MSNKSLKKKDLVNNLSLKTGFSLNYSKKLIDDFIEILIQNIKSGQLILKNFGSFKVIYKNERTGRNPKTKKKFLISSRKTISFIPSKKISDNLNKLLWVN